MAYYRRMPREERKSTISNIMITNFMQLDITIISAKRVCSDDCLEFTKSFGNRIIDYRYILYEMGMSCRRSEYDFTSSSGAILFEDIGKFPSYTYGSHCLIGCWALYLSLFVHEKGHFGDNMIDFYAIW